jgi:transposase-like protein
VAGYQNLSHRIIRRSRDNYQIRGVSRIAYMKCSHCESENVVKAGLNRSGSQRYVCKACQRHFTPRPNPMGYSTVIREQAIKMVVDGANYRRTGRYLQVNHQSVANWVTAATAKLKAGDAPRPEVGDSDTAELDELFTFVGRKKTKSTSSRTSTARRAAS